MKTKLKVKNIEDKNTKVPVNCAEHRIIEIKEEIRGCFECKNHNCKAQVMGMWESKS